MVIGNYLSEMFNIYEINFTFLSNTWVCRSLSINTSLGPGQAYRNQIIGTQYAFLFTIASVK